MFVSLCEYKHHMSTVPLQTRRGCRRPWNWNYRWLWDAMSVLRTEHRYSERARSILNSWSNSEAPIFWKIMFNGLSNSTVRILKIKLGEKPLLRWISHWLICYVNSCRNNPLKLLQNLSLLAVVLNVYSKWYSSKGQTATLSTS